MFRHSAAQARTTTAAELDDFQKAELRKWGGMVKAAGIKLDSQPTN
ncbi:hypothetical protein [Bordetella petrii]|nr:hypothetical protein [Bordetella petrii]